MSPLMSYPSLLWIVACETCHHSSWWMKVAGSLRQVEGELRRLNQEGLVVKWTWKSRMKVTQDSDTGFWCGGLTSWCGLLKKYQHISDVTVYSAVQQSRASRLTHAWVWGRDPYSMILYLVLQAWHHPAFLLCVYTQKCAQISFQLHSDVFLAFVL